MSDLAVYPGTFDPLTLGHLDLIRRSRRVFDRLIVAVAGVSLKPTGMFPLPVRMRLVRESLDEAGLHDVQIAPLDTLLVDFCRTHGVRTVVRGLRAYSDFEYEFQMALTNRKLEPQIETLFLMPSEEHSYVTASTVREIVRYGGDVAQFVPPAVHRYLMQMPADQSNTCLDKGGPRGNAGAFDR